MAGSTSHALSLSILLLSLCAAALPLHRSKEPSPSLSPLAHHFSSPPPLSSLSPQPLAAPTDFFSSQPLLPNPFLPHAGPSFAEARTSQVETGSLLSDAGLSLAETKPLLSEAKPLLSEAAQSEAHEVLKTKNERDRAAKEVASTHARGVSSEDRVLLLQDAAEAVGQDSLKSSQSTPMADLETALVGEAEEQEKRGFHGTGFHGGGFHGGGGYHGIGHPGIGYPHYIGHGPMGAGMAGLAGFGLGALAGNMLNSGGHNNYYYNYEVVNNNDEGPKGVENHYLAQPASAGATGASGPGWNGIFDNRAVRSFPGIEVKAWNESDWQGSDSVNGTYWYYSYFYSSGEIGSGDQPNDPESGHEYEDNEHAQPLVEAVQGRSTHGRTPDLATIHIAAVGCAAVPLMAMGLIVRTILRRKSSQGRISERMHAEHRSSFLV